MLQLLDLIQRPGIIWRSSPAVGGVGDRSLVSELKMAPR